MKMVKINCDLIRDWGTFHQCFQDAFGFPGFYGKNMNAWIDCMTSLDEEFSEVQAEAGELLTLQLENIKSLKERCPDVYDAIIECSAFVNYRRIELGEKPILLLSFHS
jgi:RNAse (barnase) inhibitor barstar